MDVAPDSLDWTLVRVFLAVAETGSLSAAARRLNSSQPTIGRQVRALEAQLGSTLFRRVPRGLDLTEAGAALLPPAEAMQDAMRRFALAAAGRDSNMAGTVRLTASVFMAHYVLPPILAGIRRAEPGISLDLVPTDSTENLLFREADIAVRMYRSDQLDVITRHLGDLELGIFAAKSYVARRGVPRGADDLRDHDLIGYDRNDLIIQEMRRLGIPADRGWFGLRCDNQATYWELLRAGCGIGFSQAAVARRFVEVVQILPEIGIGSLPVWLAAPEQMRRTARIRRVWDLLRDGLRPLVSAPHS